MARRSIRETCGENTVSSYNEKIQGRSASNAGMFRKAHERLAHLTSQAEEDSLYGVIAIEVVFEGGRATTVRRKSEGTDK